MSDTPETDDELNYNAFGFYTMGGLPTDAVCVDFARKLERERDAFEQRLFDVRDVLLDAMPDANAPTKILAEMLVKERNEWKEVAEGSLLGAIHERDEAVRSCQMWQDGYRALLDERDLWKAEAERRRGIKQ